MAEGQALAVPNALPAEQDATPIGPALAGIAVLSAEDPALTAPATGVDTSRVARLDTPHARAMLGAYLGQPLSRRLIGEIEAAIARHYRAQGYPFVALSTPEQEVTSGVLQVRVVEFSAGTIATTGARNESEAYVLGRVRQQTGAPIDATALTEDLDWLNRNPFRDARALFSPGDALGRSDLTLALAETRPWRIYAGATNNGAASTGRTRLFAGVQAAPFASAPDAVFAYQFTASDDVFDGAHPGYVSHAAIADLGIAARQAIEITLDHVAINQDNGPFVVRQRIGEAAIGWRVGAGAIGDLRVGVEARHARRSVRFGGASIIGATADIVQLYGGIEKVGTTSLGSYSASATVHLNPGAIGGANDRTTLFAYTDGRVTHADYVYLDLRYAGTIRLGRGFGLGTEIIGRLANRALPDTEQIGLGGTSLVRGYTLDDGAFDSGLVVRNTLNAPGVALVRDSAIADALSPYLFFDAGYARQRVTHAEAHLAAAGAGASYRLGRHLAARLEAGRAFKTAAYTEAGDWRVHASVSFAY
nr:ShlB/FhaC/HecB family hemolysin secretion/activation protein [Hephaestia sp. MAHUQ-44]